MIVRTERPTPVQYPLDPEPAEPLAPADALRVEVSDYVIHNNLSLSEVQARLDLPRDDALDLIYLSRLHQFTPQELIGYLAALRVPLAMEQGA